MKAAKEYNTLLELNTNFLNPINNRKNARENNIHVLELCKKYNVPILISSDAHIDTDISRIDFFSEILNEVNFPEKLVINNSVIDFENKIKKNRIQIN